MTSTRLASGARPRNRLFPKTRSWFALDSPLELLSPLSVLRVLLALAVVSWPVIAAATGRSGGSLVGVAVVVGVTAALWVLLLVLSAVDARGSRMLAGYWTVTVAVLVVWAHGSGAAVAFSLFFVPGLVFAALFLGRRDLLAQLAVILGALWWTTAPAEGVGWALAAATWGCLALAAAPLAVVMLARAARRHDLVDPDTGLPNGFGLAQRLRAEDHTSFMVAVVVLGGMADAREALGYQVGTELLRRAVEDLGQVLPTGGVIGRVDGDELVVTLALERVPVTPGDMGAGGTLPGAVADTAAGLADTLVRAVSAGRYVVGDIEVSLRAHVGMSAAPWDGTDMAELVRRASLSARRAMDDGRAWTVWDGDRGALTADDLSLLGHLRLAAARGQLSLAYQPQIAPDTGIARAVEALLRWQSPVHGWVSPGRFIPLAERTGLVDRLTRWVVGEALDAQVRWRNSGLTVDVSVNLSAKSLTEPDLADWILAQLHDRGLPATCLTVEVTETAVADPVAAAIMLAPLHQAGIRISIDDFGTGFTSLAALPDLPLDELKVDQRFVLRSATSPADLAIVRTVGDLAHRLGLEVVAEGVETAGTAARLAELGFDLLQGYHFARPMTEDDLVEYLVVAAHRATPVGSAGRSHPSRPRSAVRAADHRFR